MSCNFSKPTEWKHFKELSSELQTDYINNLIDTYSATAGAIAKMLGVTPSYFSKYIDSAGLGVKFSKSVRRSQEQKDAWDVFLGKSAQVEAEQKVSATMETDTVVRENPIEEQPVATVDAPKEIEQEPVKRGMAMSRFEIAFAGDIDVDMIANSLRTILGSSSSGEIRVICSLMQD